MAKRIFISIIIGIIVISGVIYYQQSTKIQDIREGQSQSEQDVNGEKQNQNEIANWKTYQDLRYGFKIKYPEFWKLISTEMNQCFKIEINNIDSPCTVLTVTVCPNNPEKLNIKEYRTKNYGWGYMGEYLVTFNGIEGVRVHTDPISISCKSDSISFTEGIFVYDIDITWSNLVDKNILENILNSFNFENLE